MQMILVITRVFLKIFSRDRQAIFFTLFFPVVFMVAFGLVSNADEDPIVIGIVNAAENEFSLEFVHSLESSPVFDITLGDQEDLRQQVISGDLAFVLLIPEDFDKVAGPSTLTMLADTSQVRQLGTLMPVVQQSLVEVERELRDLAPLFELEIEDVQSRAQNYLDFLVPGLLAFTIMQISIAGSGYNIVEFRRKGILKRLFVTPLKPEDFISGLVLSRLLICLVQLTFLLAIAIFLLKVNFVGSLANVYIVSIMGTVIFLSIGFCLGSIAKTQQAIMAIGNLVTFPQIFLSGVFYPVDVLPELIQPVARILPLTHLADALREVAINGTGLQQMPLTMIGMAMWIFLALFLAVRMFSWKEVAA